MSFRSKPEAYSFALIELQQLKTQYPKLSAIDTAIENIKIALENHEQNPAIICEFLKPIFEKLESKDKKNFEKLLSNVLLIDTKQSVKDKFQNILSRRLESEISLQLLFNPTKAMMTSVGRVSVEIVKWLDDIAKLEDDTFFINFRKRLRDNKDEPINCGAFKKIPGRLPSYGTIRRVLLENDPKNFIQIMFLHFRFSRILQDPETAILNAPARKPIGQFAEIIKEIWDEKPEKFFSDAIKAPTKIGGAFRASISSEIFFSPLYRAEGGNRGRANVFLPNRYKQFGLMLDSQEEFAAGFPEAEIDWSPDCKCQLPNPNSQFVKDLINNDAIYVAGPSGMTAALLGQMEVLANFEKLNLKQNYLSAVVSYVVGGGFHSIHEVVGPAEFVLKLVPGYQVTIPVEDKKAAPPNYHLFYQQQSKIDPEFADRRKQAWENYLNFFKKIYIPKMMTVAENKDEKKPDAPVATNEEPAKLSIEKALVEPVAVRRKNMAQRFKLFVGIKDTDKVENKEVKSEAKKDNTTNLSSLG